MLAYIAHEMALPQIPSRPYDAELLKILYDGGYVVTTDYTVNDTTYIADTTTTQNATIEAFRALWPFADETAFNAAVDTLKTDVAADLVVNPVTVPIVDALEQVRLDYTALVNTEGLTNTCPQCQAEGYTTVGAIDGSADATIVESDTCDGYGYTAVAKEPVRPITYQDIP